MHAEAAGEQPVAIGVVHQHAWLPAGGEQGPRHQRTPCAQILRGIAGDGRRAGGAGGDVQAPDLLARHREHAERERRTQLLLHGEGKAGKVGEFAKIVRVHAGRVEGGAVVGHVGVGVGEGPAQPLHLQRRQLIARSRLDRIVTAHMRLSPKVDQSGATPCGAGRLPLALRRSRIPVR